MLRSIALALLMACTSFCTASVYAAARLPADIFWLDEYGALRWEDEKARLDNFAIALLQQPGYIGYIYVWAGGRSCADEAVLHAIKAKRYPTQVRGLPWDRIAFRDLGYRDDFGVKLWLFPSGRPSWRLHPDICAFTSDVFYEGRLLLRPENATQRLNVSEPLDGTGLRFVPVEHEGNQSDSSQEVDRVAALVELMRRFHLD